MAIFYGFLPENGFRRQVKLYNGQRLSEGFTEAQASKKEF